MAESAVEGEDGGGGGDWARASEWVNVRLCKQCVYKLIYQMFALIYCIYFDFVYFFLSNVGMDNMYCRVYVRVSDCERKQIVLCFMFIAILMARWWYYILFPFQRKKLTDY